MTSSLFVDVVAEKMGYTRRPAGIAICGEGTVYPGFPGPPSMILDDGTGFWSGFASALIGGLCNKADGLWDSYLVPYGAQTIPMWVTVQELREKIVAFLLWYAPLYKTRWGVYPPTVFTGYSQGTMGIDQVWVFDILTPPGSIDHNGKPTGRLHFLKDFVYRSYQIGHIFRTPGIAHGNALAGKPESIKDHGVETGGIGAVYDLRENETNHLAPDGRPVVHSCANKGDIYTCCATGTDPWNHLAKEGKVGYIFQQIIMQPSLGAILKAATVLGEPIDGILELFHAMKFFAEGPNAPHYQYFDHMVACIDDCIQLGLSLPHNIGV
jgi:hypothetical protein